jgi:hypothetical protein
VLRPSGDLGLPLRLPGQTKLLDAALARTRPQLVVLDPIVSFLDPTAQAPSDMY